MKAEEFFRQKTIENATRPRMKKFLALVNREAEGKILEEYHKEKQRELLLAYEEFTSYKILGKKTPRISKQMVEDFLANRNNNK